jgi:hypothetical protein
LKLSTHSTINQCKYILWDIINYLFRKVTVEKSAEGFAIYPLKDGFGLLKERGGGNYVISLVFLDLCRRSLQKLHTVEYSSWFNYICVNKADPTTFLLNEGEFIQIYKVVEKKIVIGEKVEINLYLTCFYDKCVYGLEWNNETGVSFLNLYF